MHPLANPYRRLWWFLVVVIVTILVTGYGMLAYFQTDMLRRGGESLAMAAVDTADKLDRVLFERYGDSRMMARAFSPQMNTVYLTSYLLWMERAYSPYYRWMGVADADGTLIAATDPTMVGRDESTTRWFRETPRNGTILFRDVGAFPEIGGESAVSFTVAIVNESGTFQGVVMSLIDISALAAVVKQQAPPAEASLGLSHPLEYIFLAKNGNVLVSMPDTQDLSNLKASPAIQHLMTEATTAYSAEPLFGPSMPMVTGYARTHGYGAFPGMGWSVLIRAPQKELLAPIWRMAGLISLAASVVLIPVFSALFWTAGRLKASDMQLRTQQNQLRGLAAQLSRTEEQERKRLATALHDNLAQLLALIKIQLEVVTATQGAAFENIKDNVNQALAYTRSLLSELMPPLLGDKNDLQTAIAWVVKKIERHGLQVTVHDDGAQKVLSGELLTVTYQAIQELLFNVLKHARTKEAQLFLNRIGENLEVVIVDRGAGFDPSLQSTPSKDGGFGLLNIRERVEALAGRLHLASCPGGGTRATLLLPLASDVKQSQPVERSSDVQGGGPPELRLEAPDGKSPIRIALVDDHQMVRQGFRSLIEEHSDLAVVAEASDGQQAVEQARQVRPDIILMDINMPNMNGVEATRRILAECPEATVIGLSMQGDARTIHAMRDAGAIGFMSKEEAGEKLIDVIRGAWKEKLRSHEASQPG